jgi:hypothetical protein
MARPEAKLKELKPSDLRHEVGARRDLVVTLNRRSAPRLIPYGDDFMSEKLPAGTRVIYPPPPLDALPDPDAAIRYALLHPLNADPLFAQLNPNMRVTIAIDDISLPLPPMRRPDIRERLLNSVLQTLADYGVDDVHLIIATSLHRRMTESEIRRMVGERAFKQFWPERLYNFDAENRAEIVKMGKTDHGEEVWLSRRAAESDLVLYLNLNLVPMDGGHKSVAVGLEFRIKSQGRITARAAGRMRVWVKWLRRSSAERQTQTLEGFSSANLGSMLLKPVAQQAGNLLCGSIARRPRDEGSDCGRQPLAYHGI